MANNYQELQTRLVNRWDTLDNWNISQLKLLEGEIALAYVTAKQEKSDANGNIHVEYVPTYVMKVGAKKDGQLQTFKELPLLHAPASDVHEWAKHKDPTIDQLPEQWKAAYDNIISRFGSVTGTTSEGSYATVDALISAMIDNLDVADTAQAKQFVTAVAQEDGKIRVTRRILSEDDIPNLSEGKVEHVADLWDTVVGTQDTDSIARPGTGSVLSRLTNIETIIDGVSSPMEFIGVSSTDPKFADSDDTTGTKDTTNLVIGTSGSVTINGTEILKFQKGEIFAWGNKEYICTEEGTVTDNSNKATCKWALLGDVTATDARVTAVEGRMDTAETNIQDLEKAIYGNPGGDLGNNTPNLMERMDNAETNIRNLTDETIRGDAGILEYGNSDTPCVILLRCGQASSRSGIDDQTFASSNTGNT